MRIATGLQVIFKTLTESAPSIISVGILAGLCFYVYAVFGV